MPRSVLRVVAGIIALCAVGGFVMGLQGAPERGRLPGEVPQATAGVGVDAPDAKPLIDEIPPPPPAEEKKKPEDEVKKDEVDAATATLPVPPPANTAAAKPSAAEDRVGDLLDGVTPPPQEDPPH